VRLNLVRLRSCLFKLPAAQSRPGAPRIWVWMVFALLPVHAGDAVFSSNDYSDVFLPIWSYWHRANDTWVAIVSGDQRENQGISVFRWDEDSEPVLLKKSSAREGIFNVRGSALSPSGSRLLIRGFTNPVLFELNVENPTRFRRAFLLELSEAFLFWDEQRILSGAKFPEVGFKVYGKGNLTIPQIETIHGQLPKKLNHPVEPFYYKNIMHLAKHDRNVAVAFGLHEVVTVWDGKRKRGYTIGFPGYVKPPWKKPRNLKALKAWFQRFHHLFHLTWFRGELYAMFRHGYADLGVWVRFEGMGCRKVWDNNESDVRIFAMERDGLILGEKIVDNEEEVRWRLWQASSLPSL